jgi:hypothetical protein
MEIVTTLPSDKSLGYFRMSLTGHQSLPTGFRNLSQNLPFPLLLQSYQLVAITSGSGFPFCRLKNQNAIYSWVRGF